MTVGIDADGILFDYVGTCASFVNSILEEEKAHYYTATQFEPLKAWGVYHLKNDIDFMFSLEDVVRYMAVIPGAVDFIESVRVATDNDFLIITACPIGWKNERELALEAHFGISKDQVRFSERKNIFNCDILVDDYHENFNDFDGWRILIDRPWNQFTNDIAVDRAFGYTEAICKINRVLNWNK